MQLQLQTVLNKVHPLKSFVYTDIRLVPCLGAAGARIEAQVAPRRNSRGRCISRLRSVSPAGVGETFAGP